MSGSSRRKNLIYFYESYIAQPRNNSPTETKRPRTASAIKTGEWMLWPQGCIALSHDRYHTSQESNKHENTIPLDGGTTVGIHGVFYNERHCCRLSTSALWQGQIYARLVLSFKRMVRRVREQVFSMLEERMVELRVRGRTTAWDV